MAMLGRTLSCCGILILCSAFSAFEFTLNPERTKSSIFEAGKFVEVFNDPSNENGLCSGPTHQKCLRDLFYFFGGKWT